MLTLDEKTEGKTHLFEFNVEYNPHVYRRPYIAILGAWRLSQHQEGSNVMLERVRDLEFPPPRYQIESFTDRIRFLVNGMIAKHGFITVSAVFVTIASSFVGLVLYGCCVHEYKGSTDHDKSD